MNTPPLKPFQLSPSLSPISLCLDDPNNNAINNNGPAGFKHLLASPTKLKLDSSLFYRTSLSKLNEINFSGTSTTTSQLQERRKSDTFLPNSPVMLPLFSNNNNPTHGASATANNNANKPTMFKREYFSPATKHSNTTNISKASLPLLSALMKGSIVTNSSPTVEPSTRAIENDSIGTKSNNTNGLKSKSKSKLTIKESLEQFQQKLESSFKDRQPLSTPIHMEQHSEITNERESNTSERTNNDDIRDVKQQQIVTEINEPSSTISSSSLLPLQMEPTYERDTLNPLYSDYLKEAIPEKPNVNVYRGNSMRMSSTATTLYTPLEEQHENQIQQDLVDMNGFAKPYNTLSTHGNQLRNAGMNENIRSGYNNSKNRYSFISSTSTDYDIDWYDQVASQNGVNNGMMGNRMMRSSPVGMAMRGNSGSSNTNGRNSFINMNMNIDEISNGSEEKEVIDLKIKKLELEINELKLQNEKLINSISKKNLIEDKILLGFFSQQQQQRHNATNKKMKKSKKNTKKEKYSNESRSGSRGIDNTVETSKKETNDESMEMKLKEMEMQFRNYQKMLTDLTIEQKERKKKSTRAKCGDKNKNKSKSERPVSNQRKERLARISSRELKKIEEQNDSISDLNTSFTKITTSEGETNEAEEEEDLEYEDEYEYSDDEEEQEEVDQSLQSREYVDDSYFSEEEKKLNVTQEQLEDFRYNSQEIEPSSAEEDGDDHDDGYESEDEQLETQSRRIPTSSLSSGKTGFQLNFHVQPVHID
ncbi:Mmr1p NDAI_0E04380 [Naumovozyma dairenensis CBS 421]|uniref:Uncharacterized protein n=1 Tax=Naumovozyma dairenensis (strain ATCC 10597 / BCRC 20456 / CBS 421 / NBRC 0211 / NRRL Y-12639) TaxID=1071378 RepID=G0WBY5_NAUDC|nr:hypothetical protein NDAI_0E04380 [Naumovozyma dairenensis CBS 421]CCD25255.1 hypothetical protein NDAI_0E04380 [Naumovozyma dairenensis CBS 421]